MMRHILARLGLATEVNSGFFRMVHGRLTVPDLARLQRLLLVDPISKRSEFDRLKDVAQAARRR